jgi:hypothetical protein
VIGLDLYQTVPVLEIHHPEIGHDHQLIFPVLFRAVL